MESVWLVGGLGEGLGDRLVVGEERGRTYSCVMLDAFGYDGVDCLLALVEHGGGRRAEVRWDVSLLSGRMIVVKLCCSDVDARSAAFL